MKIVYDESKRLSNIAKHALDFAEIDLAFFEAAIVVAAKARRFKAIGPFRDGLTSVVFFQLGEEGLSLISMRPASKKERLLYDQR
ncbi:BrnT family toxin [Pararhizobium arenae]|uniref:BrnT family toxin n=1 Tax=Pararhizobium arenae TaxID=1856850 RepID=UPI00094B7647|nr:BrnT family toxin [Pararhizobium arenae]